MRPIISATERFILYVLSKCTRPVSAAQLYEIIGSSDLKHFSRCCRTLLVADMISIERTPNGSLYSIPVPATTSETGGAL